MAEKFSKGAVVVPVVPEKVKGVFNPATAAENIKKTGQKRKQIMDELFDDKDK
jgi:hypothetical protein